MVLTTFHIRIKKVYISRAIIAICILIIYITGIKLYIPTIGHDKFSYSKLRSYKFENLTKYLRKLKFGYSTDETVKETEITDYSKYMIGLDQVGNLGSLNKEDYKSVKGQLLEEAQFILDHEPKFFNTVERGGDRLELEFYMQYARDVENGKRGDELEPEWQWAKDISIVYTWINGTDEKLLEKKAKLNGGIKKADQRDRCIDELRYSIRSLCKNLPWHKGQIFIVSPGQTPYWLDTSNPRIKVIDQDDILPKYDGNGKPVSPTFNSFAIEWFLDRVPGVSEQFIQLNDEYFFRRPVHPSFFFYGGGEGYKNKAKIEEFRKNNPVESQKKSKSKGHEHFYKRDNIPNNKDDDDDNYYVHGLKIDKDIREMVAEELKNVTPEEQRNLFFSKRSPQNDHVEDIEDFIKNEMKNEEEENKNQEEINDDLVDMGMDMDNDNDNGNDNDNNINNIVDNVEEFINNSKGGEKGETEDGEKPDNEDGEKPDNEDGEKPDNEDGELPEIEDEETKKDYRNVSKMILKTDDLEINSDNSTSIVRREKVLYKRPFTGHYVFPNAAQHYRFINLYFADEYLVGGFNKARDVARRPFNSTTWKQKFFGAMAMTNACIAEDLGQSTLVNMLEHAPYVWDRDLFELCRRRYKQYVNLTLSHKFRHPLDFVPPFANNFFLRHYASQAGFEKQFDDFYKTKYVHDVDENDDPNQKTRDVLKFGFHIVDFNIRVKVLSFGAVYDDTKRNARTFKRIIEHKTLLFFNINDDYNDLEAGKQFSQFMEYLYPEPSIFEKKDSLP